MLWLLMWSGCHLGTPNLYESGSKVVVKTRGCDKVSIPSEIMILNTNLIPDISAVLEQKICLPISSD